MNHFVEVIEKILFYVMEIGIHFIFGLKLELEILLIFEKRFIQVSLNISSEENFKTIMDTIIFYVELKNCIYFSQHFRFCHLVFPCISLTIFFLMFLHFSVILNLPIQSMDLSLHLDLNSNSIVIYIA